MIAPDKVVTESAMATTEMTVQIRKDCARDDCFGGNGRSHGH